MAHRAKERRGRVGLAVRQGEFADLQSNIVYP